jgi:nitric oxide reductase NorQ protein
MRQQVTRPGEPANSTRDPHQVGPKEGAQPDPVLTDTSMTVWSQNNFLPTPPHPPVEPEERPLLGPKQVLTNTTLIPPRVLAVLYPAMDGRGVITIPAHGNEVVEATEGFYVCAGHNPGVHGAVLTEALASRFTVHLHVTTDWDLARLLGVPKAVIAAAQNLNTDLDAGRVTWAPQLRELLGFVKVSQQLGQPTALSNLAGIAPDDARADVAVALARHTGAPVTALAIGTR